MEQMPKEAREWVKIANMAADIRARIQKANEPRPLVQPNRPVFILPTGMTGQTLKKLKRHDSMFNLFPYEH